MMENFDSLKKEQHLKLLGEVQEDVSRIQVEEASVSQFFHILGSVAQQRGVTNVRNEEYEFTLYSSCCNTRKGIYYYTTYENSQICAVDMHKEDLDGSKLVSYPLDKTLEVQYQN